MTSPQVAEKAFFILDASIWVSRLVSQDASHPAVKAWMEEQREAGRQFISPTLLLAEVGGAISRRTGDPLLGQRAISQLENLPGLRLVEMDNELVHEALMSLRTTMPANAHCVRP